MQAREIELLESYLCRQFAGARIILKPRKVDDSVEVLLRDEFIGVIYKDEDEGETSYTFTMSILDIDLQDAA